MSCEHLISIQYTLYEWVSLQKGCLVFKMNVYFQNRACEFNISKVAATLTGYVKVTPEGDEEALKEAVATIGPMSVGIDASHSSFQSYESGQFLSILTFFISFSNSFNFFYTLIFRISF